MLNFYSVYFPLIESLLSRCLPATDDLATILFLLVLILLAKLEWRFPKIQYPRERIAQSYRINFGLFMFNSIVVSLVPLASLAVLVDDFSGAGLLSLIPGPIMKALVSFLLLDLFLYLWHRLCHSFDGLWMFHKVHHDDPALNLSTAFRVHFAETLLTGLLKTIYIVLLGLDKKAIVAYEAVYTVFVMFHHANISFRGERLLGHIVITPFLHRSHHSKERKEHDSNYGAIFSIWDRMLRTLKLVEPAAIGIKVESRQTLWGQICLGFTREPLPAGSAGIIPVQVHAMIAEAAYYKAEKRSFSPGYELCDWLEAQQEISRRVGKNTLGCY